MRPHETKLGRRLLAREHEALARWHEARQFMPAMTEKEFNTLLRVMAQPLTWWLWEMAIQESERA